MRRREKLHKRELLQWRKHWSERLSADADAAATSEGPLEVPPVGPQQELPPDKEARLASRAAAQAAREAATLIGAQVVMTPSGYDEHMHGRHRPSRVGGEPGVVSTTPLRNGSLQPGALPSMLQQTSSACCCF